MNKILPSRLKALFFTKMYVEAVPSDDVEAKDISVKHIHYKHAKQKINGTETGYRLEISTKVQDATQSGLDIPYVFAIEAFAVFEQDYQPAEDEVARAQYFSDRAGYTALVGAIREGLASWTARGPWGSAMLPLISILPLVGAYPKPAQTDAEAPDVPKKVARKREIKS